VLVRVPWAAHPQLYLSLVFIRVNSCSFVFNGFSRNAHERSLQAVRDLVLTGALLLVLQIGFRTQQAAPSARAEALGAAPSATSVRLASLSERLPHGLLALRLQAFDNQPGSASIRRLGLRPLVAWLDTLLQLDRARIIAADGEPFVRQVRIRRGNA